MVADQSAGGRSGSPASGPVTLAVALGALTLGVAATAPALVETIGQTSPADHRGAVTALYGFVLFLGASLAAPAATLAAGYPYPTAAVGFAAVAALGSVGALLGTRPS